MKKLLRVWFLIIIPFLAKAQNGTMYFNGIPFHGQDFYYCSDTCIQITFVAHDSNTHNLVYKLYDSFEANPIVNTQAPTLWESQGNSSLLCLNDFDTGYVYMMIYTIGEWNGLNDRPDTIKQFFDAFRVVPCGPSVKIVSDTVICLGDCLSFEAETENSPFTWDWLSVGAMQSTASGATANFCYGQPGIYEVRCIVSNSIGRDTDYVHVSVYESPAVVMPADTFICTDVGFLIEPQVIHANQWLWNTGETTEHITVHESGIYSLIVTNGHCSNEDSIIIGIGGPPEVHLENEITLCSDETLKISVAQENHAEYIWNNGSSSPEIWVDSAGTYSVQITNMCGSVKKEMSVYMEDCFCLMFVPNTFTPDGSDFNEIFKPEFDCRIKYYEMSIYNRWGQLIFKTAETLYGWDGQFEGKPAPMDIYAVVIKYAGLDVKNLSQKESRYALTLLR